MLLMLLEQAAFASGAGGEHVGFGPQEFWAAAGPEAKLVILTLIGMTLGCVFVAIERALAFNRGRRQSMQLAAAISGPLQQGDIAGALKLSQEEAYKSAYLGTLLRAGLVELNHSPDAFGLSNAHRSLTKASAEEIAKLKRGFAILATTGSTAPFVGLFGTTFGVINAFSGMATSGAGLAGISAGISEALYTTAIGIGVAIIGVWLFNYYNGKIEKVTNELNSSEADFLDWAEKLVHNGARAAGK